MIAAPIACLCISSITEGKLHFGLAKRPKAEKLRGAVHELLLRLDVVPLTSTTARRCGSVRANAERAGKPLAPLDLLIAAHALERDAILVTNDAAFAQVAGLRVEDWTIP